MKLPIKFRGQDIKTGEYVYGDLIHPWADDEIYPSIRSATDYVNGVASLGYYAVDPDSVTQLSCIDDDGEHYVGDKFYSDGIEFVWTLEPCGVPVEEESA